MLRALVISAIAALALALIAMAGVLAVFHTAAGRSIIAAIIENELAAEVGGDVKIGAVAGALPDQVILRAISFEQEGATWLHIDRVEIDWSALAALRGRIEIERLAVNGAQLLAPPPKQAEDQAKIPEPLRLPSGLPNLVIRNILIDGLNVDAAIAGRPLRLDGAGGLAMNDRALDLRIDATSRNDSDTINAAIALDHETGSASIDVLIASEADGFIASIAALDGPLFIEASGQAPLADFSMQVSGVLGAYGAIDITLRGDLNAASALRMNAMIQPGDKLADLRAELGDSIDLDAILSDDQGAPAVDIDRFESAAGGASGKIVWREQHGLVQSVSGAIKASLAEDYRPEIQALIGREAQFEFQITPEQSFYALNAALSAPAASLTLENARTDFDTNISGLATLVFAAGSAFPAPFDEGVSAQALISLADGGPARLQEFVVTTPDGARFDGEGRWDNARKALALGGEASFSAAVINKMIGFSPTQPVLARLSASGPLDRVAGEIELDLPRTPVDAGAIPAARATLGFNRTDAGLTANIEARSKENAGALKARVVLSNDGTVSVSGLDLTSRTFTLSGSGAYRRNQDALDIDLAYVGKSDAEPWPGLPLAGMLTAKGSIARKGSSNDLALTASHLVMQDIAVGTLEARVSGPSNALTMDGRLADMLLPGLGAIDSLQLAGRADLSGPPNVTISRLEGALSGVAIKLTAPAYLIFDDGVVVSGARAAFGEKGALSLDGEFSPTRWRATLAAKDAPIPGQDAFVTAKLDLDTDRETAARGDFMARSRIIASTTSTLAGSLTWDGRKLALANASPDDAFAYNLSLPLILDRSPRLNARLDGAMHGAMRYDGRIETLAPYFPPSLQALEGALAAQATIAGTVSRPEIVGRLALQDGAYTELGSGVSIDGINGEAAASAIGGATSITFDFRARGLGQDTDTVSFAGSVSLAEVSTINGALSLDGARFASGPVSSAIASGDITITGPLNAVTAKGAIVVTELNAEIITAPASHLVDIDVTPIGALNGGNGGNGESNGFDGPPLVLALNISGAEKIFVRGRGLESEWRADIAITGDAKEPLIEGDLALRRGYLDFAGRRFTLTRGQIAFDRYAPNNPMLDLRAEHVTSDSVTAIIEIKGRAQSPNISLQSTPPRPPDDVMALVLFGKPAIDLSALQSLQVAQALAQLTGVGPFGGAGITGAARKALGVDMLSFDIDPETGASALEVGKYVADGLFVSATQDVRGENGSARIEYEITNSVTIETQIKQSGDQTVSANWKIDF